MPQVLKNSFIAYISQLYEVNQGFPKNITIILYQNHIGNQIEAYNVDKITIDIYNNQLQKKKTLTRNNKNRPTAPREYNLNNKNDEIKLGSISQNTEGYVTFEIDEELSNNLEVGDLYTQITLTYENSEINFPKFKIAKVLKPGQLPSDVSRRDNLFTIPAPVFKIKNNDYSQNPEPGEVIINSYEPLNITKIKFNNTDTRGKRNSYLENTLMKRFSQDGLSLNLAITNTYDTSKYSIYKITNWNRIDKDNNSQNDDYNDVVEIDVQFESRSTEKGNGFLFQEMDKIGILLDSYNDSAGSNDSNVDVNDGNNYLTSVNEIKFIQGAEVIDGGTGTAEIKINSVTTKDITPNINIGALNSGDVIPSGTDIEQLIELLTIDTFEPNIEPSNAPIVDLTHDQNQLMTVGTEGDITLNSNLNRGIIKNHWDGTDQGYYAGPITNVELEKGTDVYSISYTNPEDISQYIESNYNINLGNNEWKILVTLDSNSDYEDSDGNIISSSGYSGGTITDIANIEGVYPLFKGASNGSDNQISTLYSHSINSITISQDFDETNNIRHKIIIPNDMIGNRTVNLQQYDYTSNEYKDLDSSEFKEESVSKWINGSQINYTKYTKDSAPGGGDEEGIPLYKVEFL